MGIAYDVIVVGARCAGSPLAMLLARRGHRVLLLDRATFPSDTVSTHLIHPPGAAALHRWGLLDRVTATGCPPIGRYTFDFGPLTLGGAPGTPDSPFAYAPRRTVLDKILVDAAAEAGAEVREAFTVDEVRAGGEMGEVHGRDPGGSPVVERARVVVGADGRNSVVAKAVRPHQYHERPPLTCGYYSYWSDLPLDGTFEIYSRPGRGWAACPTNDGLTMVIGGWPYAELAEHRNDIEGALNRTFELEPGFAERLRGATRESRFAGTSVPNYFRTPFGPGWALVGDAGYNRDFITAQGITDAFQDAELCAGALDEALGGKRPYDEAMEAYRSARDARAMPMYEMTAQIAALEPPDPQMIQLVAAMRGDQDTMDAFARVNSGATSPAEFFAPENVARIIGRAEQTR
ncbi:NAD(P)/FAD-dependent oxidoreductase [Amorphoplanes digitatis]|uniref:2-polyprenyl-6-methoxyphenol hydroxylase-like FAD-dependent oxidoreductase n=1 Tax=Actinoplanes digitatis TaxID=1868 RepID=A0A7W7HZZ7_9ACTN|nr:NAD(P)/FAD-dependent oxidoreductase [Actinoplanes digitatis]MBB4763907.1 2-polyprenyl-6-methoxyphenol hydroxylase-like FAD-dependent oxidoreductase [Actinoplanes digitatis]GID93726.1 FAD-dependent oxidoreductase [Actinoplanes digitatis]